MKIIALASALALGLASSAFAAEETVSPDAKGAAAGAAGAADAAGSSDAPFTTDELTAASSSRAEVNTVTAPAIEWPVVQEGPMGTDAGQEATKGGASSSSTGASPGTEGSDAKDSKTMKKNKEKN